MRLGRPTPAVLLTYEERETLQQWARRPKTVQALAQRARIVLACATERTNGDIAVAAGVTRQTVGRPKLHSGRPLPGAEVYVLDDDGRVRPDGEIGELAVHSRSWPPATGATRSRPPRASSPSPGCAARRAATRLQHEPPAEDRLVGYIIPSLAPPPTVSALRRSLAARLPHHRSRRPSSSSPSSR